MDRPALILIGGGGHCRSVIDVIAMEGRWRIAGILDVAEKVGTEILGHSIIGTDERIPDLVRIGHHFLVTAGHVGDPALRIRAATSVVDAGGELVTVISPLAHVSANARIGPGCWIGHKAVVNASAIIASNCIVNTAALVEHDSTIGHHCHIATGAIVNGGCTVGDGTLIGSGAILLQGISIGRRCRVGAGSVVTRPVLDDAKVMGAPASER